MSDARAEQRICMTLTKPSCLAPQPLSARGEQHPPASLILFVCKKWEALKLAKD